MEGYSTAAINQAPKSKDSISSMVNELDRDIERLEKLYQQMDQLGDGLEGSRPRDAAGQSGVEQPPAQSLADNLRRKRQRLTNLIGRCEEAFSRVASALG